MEQQDTIWILVPVYNVEKVLDKCIRSVQRQTYTNWKMVLVDDGSTDRSGSLCDEYAAKDPRVISLHTPNGGPHRARMTGLELVPDDSYCCFCDSDDELPENALQLLYEEALRTNADLVCGYMERFYKGIRFARQKLESCGSSRVYTKEEIISDLYVCCFGGGRFPVNLVAKLYKTSILKEAVVTIIEHPKCFAEDLNVTMHLMPLLMRVSVINDIVYRYRIGGGTSRFMPTFLDDNILMYRLKMQWSDKCTSTEDVKRLIGVELKNIIVSYWIMCEKNRRYPQGSLLEEVKAVCALPEVQEALTTLHGDRSGLLGVNQPLVNRDYDAVCNLIRQKVKKDRPKDIIKKILVG